MSEIRINIFDKSQAISGTLHGSIGEVLVAALTAEPESIEELETAVERFIKPESDWSIFRSFSKFENFEPYDAGLLIIDLTAKLIMVDSTYSHFSNSGGVRIKSDTGEDFGIPYELSNDWKTIFSEPEFNCLQKERRDEFLNNPPLDARKILFGKPLFKFITDEFAANRESEDGNLFTEIHAKWLMTVREDLRGKTPREILLDKRDFISSDLNSRARQWSFTNECPPALSENSNAYKFAGFGTHEIVIYYDLFRFLLDICFEQKIREPEMLEQAADFWLTNRQPEFSGRTPAEIIETERKRINLTASAHECLIEDDDCETCEMLALDFIDTPMFWHFDGSHMEFDRFEFSLYKTREEWEKEQLEYEEFSRRHEKQRDDDDDIFDDEIIY